jgi:hypothetical protein
MSAASRRQLSTWHRGRLAIALAAITGFAILFAIGFGHAVHARSETQDSIAHWQARLAEDAANPQPPTYAVSSDAPASRIRRLEGELAKLDERLPLYAIACLVAIVLVILGVHVLRKGVRVR